MRLYCDNMRGTLGKPVFLGCLVIFSGALWYSMKGTIKSPNGIWRDDSEEQSMAFQANGRRVSEHSLEKYGEENLPGSVSLDVYYESLSSDSYVFVKEQLKNVVDRARDRVTVKFIPFGKSSVMNRGKSAFFYCHRGPKECQGNKYHACILTRSKSQTQRTNMVLCMLRKGFVQSMETAAELCCSTFGLDFLDVRLCATSQEGTKLLGEHAASTHTVNVVSVPTIAIDGLVGPAAFQHRALTNLKEVVCKSLANKGGKADGFC